MDAQIYFVLPFLALFSTLTTSLRRSGATCAIRVKYRDDMSVPTERVCAEQMIP